MEQEKHEPDEIEITPQMLAEFVRIFDDWQNEYPNYEVLRAGGLGDLESLAIDTWRWANRPVASFSKDGGP